jgi:hypothetical protein
MDCKYDVFRKSNSTPILVMSRSRRYIEVYHSDQLSTVCY